MTKLGLLGRIVGGLGLACVALVAVGLNTASYAGDASGNVAISKPGQIANSDAAALIDLLSQIAAALPESDECGCADAAMPAELASSGCVASPSQIAEPLRLLLDRRAEGTIVSPSKTAAVRPVITWQILPDEGGELMSIAEIMSPGGIGRNLPEEIDLI
jgi:hypothetical protein